MQAKKILIIALSSAMTLAATQSMAIMSVPNGWYAEGNVGSAKLTNKSDVPSDGSSGIGGNVNLGYKFMPFFGLEIGYSQYPNSVIRDSNGTEAAKDKHYSYGIWGRGIVPISDSGFELFAKLGVSRITSSINIQNQTAANNMALDSSSHSATGLYWGVGGQYYLMPEFAIVGQWQTAQGNDNTGTESLLSIGISFIID